MGMPVTVAMGNAYYVFFMPMVIATRMRMPTVMGMPMTMCTGTYTIGKHAARLGTRRLFLTRRTGQAAQLTKGIGIFPICNLCAMWTMK